ncbi:hypothetical protein niasHT_030608 [Heterodera trifolii]|uniref:non-specific serine/threonine protein kinase n=1 Tax=Heterodera trifolii TaxID=157864 RepID=A0ABD2IRG2_9BILA
MFKKFAGSSALWKPRNPHSLEYLRYLHGVLMKNDKITEANSALVVEALRAITEIDDHKVPMEIALLARCSNVSGVIALIDWFSLPEGFLIVMERPIPCMDLFDFIHHQKMLDENLARFLFRPIVKSVIELTERKVLHRDLKDENILINLANARSFCNTDTVYI